MWIGVQWTGTIGPNVTVQWFTWVWPASWHVVGYMMPTSNVSLCRPYNGLLGKALITDNR
jgi:hypothetical protein